MKRSQLDKYFREVGAKAPAPLRIYLTGGVLAWFYGKVRPTQDLDFALKTHASWDEVSTLLKTAALQEGIAVEFSEDISRWGMVGYSHYEKGARLYKSFGKLKVFLLDPVAWSVGKLSRYTSDDLADLVSVFRKQKPPLSAALRIWTQALLESPPSSEQGLFIKKVGDFLSRHGKDIWGRKFSAEKTLQNFHLLLRRKRS
ncbi:MAG TPA: hypothetical protein DF383_06980 [Deltaproteobacteria bacterium]|nr:hypothetical protein [Deltaproteobacteria bacterium]